MYCAIPEHILRGISDLAKKLHFFDCFLCKHLDYYLILVIFRDYLSGITPVGTLFHQESAEKQNSFFCHL